MVYLFGGGYMNHNILYLLIGLATGFFVCLIAKKIVSLENIINNIVNCFNGIILRIDKMLTGNDGNYSHVRFTNILWGIGNFVLIFIAVMKEIEIPGTILVFMGTAMGISNTQAVLNKRQEVKQFISGLGKDEEEK